MKTNTNLPREAIRPPPPPLELSGSAHACLTVEFYFLFLHVSGLAIILSYFLELIDRTAQMRRLICAFDDAYNKVELLAE